ncbi:MAG TPA: hypothetical protein VKP13_12785 [Nitrospira sp.]|nr:hypothetical protein [Nitrospira sp.]
MRTDISLRWIAFVCCGLVITLAAGCARWIRLMAPCRELRAQQPGHCT